MPQSRIADAASGRSGWLRFVFIALYPLGADRPKRGRRNATLRRYKAGRIFEGVVADCSGGCRIVEAKESADGRGPDWSWWNRRT